VNDKFETLWRKLVVTRSTRYFRICGGDWRKRWKFT